MAGYGLLGKNLIHSYSPQIHAMLGDYPYSLIQLAEEELPVFIKTNQLEGFNVTIPYKQTIMPFLSDISPLAAEIGSVNTVIRQKDGSLVGDNTDAWGFRQLLGEAKDYAGKKALILGSGGSSKTVMAVLRKAQIETVIISRTGANQYDHLDKHLDAGLVVNTTPLGMYPNNEAAPLSLRPFHQCRLVIDLIYNPCRTKLLQQADELGIQARGGLLMLAAQAQRASELWGLTTGTGDKSREIADKLSRTMRNLVLIGMPGCGKTSIAQALHRLTGRIVFDTDRLIEEKAGMNIPRIIEKSGIAGFRLMETEVIRQVSKESAAIIATGGGAVTVAKNLPILQQNGRIVWIKRDPGLLPVTGRPLSLGQGVEALYAERKGLYAAWSERAFDNVGIDRTAKEIGETML